MKKRILYFILISITSTLILTAQKEKSESKGKFHGYMVGDYYYNVDQHNQDLKEKMDSGLEEYTSLMIILSMRVSLQEFDSK